MYGKITIEITDGVNKGQKYEYTEAERIFIGRQADCGIVIPDQTVSRYHCLMTINPPSVRLQDFGSLNGTYINGDKIGQRDRSKPREAAKEEISSEFEISDGDRIRLGKRCELKCSIDSEDTSGETVYDFMFSDAALHTAAISNESVPPKEDPAKIEMAGNERSGEERAEKEKAEKEKAEKEKEKAEKEKAGNEKAGKDKARKERIAREVLARMQAEKERKEQQKDEQEKAEQERIEQEKAERERIEQEKAERERIEREKAERERIEREKAERERIEREKAERERIEREEAEKKNKPAQPGMGERICNKCGKPFTPGAADDDLCPECLDQRGKLIEGILAAMLGDAARKREASPEPSVLEGYEKAALLGRGGMGEVWKIREIETGKLFALKTMLPKVAADKRGKKLFLREAYLCEQLEHKNVVRTYQTGCVDDVFYILMDLCEGGSAQDLIERNWGKLSLNMATYIILQALSGLDYVHNLDIEVEIKRRGFWASGTEKIVAHGIVHRDFKPGNIFLSDKSDRPAAMVADFGMAKAFETAGLSDTTRPDQTSGTVAFMPRQQALDYRYSKPEVDVWAAAASYYYMLTGKAPKNLKPGSRLWESVVKENAVPIRRRDPSIPAQLASVIDRALIEVPDIVYKSAADFRRDIIAALPASVRAYCDEIL